jgi:hypothetical protein
MVWLIGMSPILAKGQTITNAEPTTVIFTNKMGILINAEVVKADATTITYRLTEGGGGVVKFTDLPAPIRAQFGFNPDKAAQAEKAEREAKARQQAASAIDMEKRRKIQQAANEVAASAGFINGWVFQKTITGCLVECGNEQENQSMMRPWIESGTWTRRALTGVYWDVPYSVVHNPGEGLPPIVSGHVFLAGASFYEGQRIQVIAYRMSEDFSYTTVSSAARTIPQMTTDFGTALRLHLGTSK